MCGRYSFFVPIEQAETILHAKAIPWEGWEPRYNAAPTQIMPVVTNFHPSIIQFFKWGLVPRWAKDVSMGAKMVNTRAESIAEKPAFRNIFKYKRCIVLASGYYEWQSLRLEASAKPKAKPVKQPWHFHLPGHDLLLMAGLWDEWGHEGLQTFSIITCESNSQIQPIHNRMPVILGYHQIEQWLNNQTGLDDLLAILKPAANDLLQVSKVSTYVNKAGNEGTQAIEVIE